MEQNNTFEDQDGKRSAKPVLSALQKAEKDFNSWQSTCDEIDNVYNLKGLTGGQTNSWNDSKLDLFWASFEVLKPAVYARAPVPAVSPIFKDGKPLLNKTAELLERASVSAFVRTNINEVMYAARDDLLFAGRGVLWVRYETDDSNQNACVDYIDRRDFLHEPCRTWDAVGWVARRAWMSKAEVEKRFKKTSKGAYKQVKYSTRRNKGSDDNQAVSEKGAIWEVWHKADNKVYWVSEGVDSVLDEGEPQLKLTGFFPCPKPAYATLQRRSLIPVPDWERYAIHFRKISELTGRIYKLLDSVRMKGLVPAGSEVGDAVEQLLRSNDDSLVIPVNGAGLTASSGRLVEWLPVDMVASAIAGLIEARSQLISDFYELSGISDIMRGATEASETLGAQQLKTQYGSVRVQCKIDELQRIAADCVRIVAEVIAEKFTQKHIMDMAQIELPTKKDIEKRIKEIEKAAEEEMKALADQFEQAGQLEPEQAQQAQAAFEEQQQAIYQKYAPMLAEAESQIPIDDVMKLLRDDKARSFAFEVESDSTILTDELQEKASRQEFMEAFMASSQGLMQMASTGEEGAALAGELMKFVLAPYRVGRQLDDSINTFVDSAPQLAAALGEEGEDQQGLIEANNKLAEAEQIKAQAAMESVKTKAMKDQADMQARMQDMEIKAQQDQQKYELDVHNMRMKMTQQQQDFAAKMAETDAKVNKMQAETAKILASIGLDVRKQGLEEYRAAEQSQEKTIDRAIQVENRNRDDEFRERGEQRADMQVNNEGNDDVSV